MTAFAERALRWTAWPRAWAADAWAGLRGQGDKPPSASTGAGIRPSEVGVDRVLVAAVLLLAAFGSVMIFSAGAVFAAKKYGDPFYFLKRELVYGILGLCAFTVALRVDYGVYRRYAYPLLIFCILLLVAVLKIGSRAGGAIRWFRLGPLSFQPGELAKFALALYLATLLARKAEHVRDFSVGFLPPLLVTGVLMGLLLKQPDLGTAVIFGAVALGLLFIAGTRTSYLILAVLVAAPIGWKFIVSTPFRMRRMLAFLDPWAFRRDVGYQITESLISVGSGGVAGLGLGDGRQKLFFLPEAHTDFILSIVGEELGLLGVSFVIVAFAVLVWRGLRAAVRARDPFGCYLAFGISAMFGLQALVNIGVVLGSLPTKGLPLPFISYGGTSLLVSLFMAGVLANISARHPEPRDLPWWGGRPPGGRHANKRSDREPRLVIEVSPPRKRRQPADVATPDASPPKRPSRMTEMRLLIAGGGTGGHLYPGIAIAEEVMRRPAGQVLFVGTARGLESKLVPAAGFPLELLEVSGLNRVGVTKMLRGLLRLPKAFFGSRALLRRFRPDLVIGVGGYASGPVVFTAALLGYPTAIQEQNSHPGFTNRVLGRVVRRVFVAFDDAGRFFAQRKLRAVGNPIRRRFLENAEGAMATPPIAAGAPSQAPTVLVVGGSQGARAVNDLVIGAAAALAATGQLPRIVHQTGAGDEARVRQRYAELNLKDGAAQLDIRPFIDDMPATLAAASLVVGRAGALTLAELAMVGRPAILIPLPTAADDHQSRNAEAFARAGAAVIAPQGSTTPADLARLIGELVGDPARRAEMSRAMTSLSRPRAAVEIVDELELLTKPAGAAA